MGALKNIVKIVSGTIASSAGRKAKRKPPARLADAHFDAAKEIKSEYFTVGFGSAEILPGDILSNKYWVAGYKANNRATGMLDPQTAQALWLDDGNGKGGVLFVSVDCVGLMNWDVLKIRDYLAAFKEKSACRSISIASTHTHAGVDTMGLWGPTPRSGKNKEFMKKLYDAVLLAAEKAYADRREGSLYLGRVRVPDIQKDSRLPNVYSDVLTRIRFSPNDGSKDIYWVKFDAHPESMTGNNSIISSDVPYFMRSKIKEVNGAELVYSSGAIGGLIAFKPLSEDNIESTRMAGHILADAALGITDEEKLTPRIGIIRQDFYIDVENPVLTLATIISLMKAKRYATGSGSLKTSLKSEMTYMEIGSLKIVMLPGEIFPELAYGGYLEADIAATGENPDINPKPLTEIAGDENLLIIGLANDEIGYIVTPNDWYLNPEKPYIEKAIDSHNRRHYEETNSLGPKTAFRIAEIFTELIQKAKA